VKKKTLTIFSHMILYLNLMKTFHFLRQIVKGDEKWILYNKMARKKPWKKLNEPQLTTPNTGYITW